MLRLTVFEIFAVKWAKFRSRIPDLEDPWGHRPQQGRRPVRNRHVQPCKISRRSVPDREKNSKLSTWHGE